MGVGLAVLLLVGCSEKLSVEQQVIGTLESMEIAAEDGSHLEFMRFVADDFSGQYGSMDRRGFHRFMIFQMNAHRRLQVRFFPIHVSEIDQDHASAQFRILVTGGRGLVPDSGQLFDVETVWLRDGSDWQLLKADWQPLQGDILWN